MVEDVSKVGLVLIKRQGFEQLIFDFFCFVEKNHYFSISTQKE